MEKKKFNKDGMWVEPAFPQMFGLKMLMGNYASLKDPSSIFLSQSLAKAFYWQ